MPRFDRKATTYFRFRKSFSFMKSNLSQLLKRFFDSSINNNTSLLCNNTKTYYMYIIKLLLFSILNSKKTFDNLLNHISKNIPSNNITPKFSTLKIMMNINVLQTEIYISYVILSLYHAWNLSFPQKDVIKKWRCNIVTIPRFPIPNEFVMPCHESNYFHFARLFIFIMIIYHKFEKDISLRMRVHKLSYCSILHYSETFH